MEGLSECKALESNIKRIRVKVIVKKVKDYLKTYSSAGMDISWQETQYLLKARQKIENLNEVRVKELRSDNGTDVAERRNRTLIEAARTMLNSVKLPKQFWGEAVNTACYTQNRSIIVKRHGKTSYDVFRGRSPDISYFHVFGCPVHIHNHMDHLGKFDEKADDGFFLSYSPVAKAFRVFNIRRQEMEEAMMNSLNQGVKLLSALAILNPPEFTEADDHPALNEPDQIESADHFEPIEPQNNVIIKTISDIQPSPIISPSADVILQTHVPQDRWSREKHIELVNIIGEPLTAPAGKSIEDLQKVWEGGRIDELTKGKDDKGKGDKIKVIRVVAESLTRMHDNLCPRG
ncbi:retrovirus-related pol polyprotein from transposon TNT 1-94 [Tanacetum coccineum]|uniref:Retrovirus-related pol polyprotein from transposon TNT 1-94 n=1 Tax=Tanacetum coccineum TaxID=301880 RepID=A0ABQ4ZZZ1_9ASTR